MKIELLMDLPVATIHKCTKGKVYDNAKMIPHREIARLGKMVITAESGEEVTVLKHEYKVLEYDNESKN